MPDKVRWRNIQSPELLPCTTLKVFAPDLDEQISIARVVRYLGWAIYFTGKTAWLCYMYARDRQREEIRNAVPDLQFIPISIRRAQEHSHISWISNWQASGKTLLFPGSQIYYKYSHLLYFRCALLSDITTSV